MHPALHGQFGLCGGANASKGKWVLRDRLTALEISTMALPLAGMSSFVLFLAFLSCGVLASSANNSIIQHSSRPGDGLISPDESGSAVAANSLVCDDIAESLLCPVTCFRPEPVCGANGVTYWCGCRDAKCANVEVAHLGFCELHNAGSEGKGMQALLLVHTVWLILLGLSCLFERF